MIKKNSELKGGRNKKESKDMQGGLRSKEEMQECHKALHTKKIHDLTHTSTPLIIYP